MRPVACRATTACTTCSDARTASTVRSLDAGRGMTPFGRPQWRARAFAGLPVLVSPLCLLDVIKEPAELL